MVALIRQRAIIANPANFGGAAWGKGNYPAAANSARLIKRAMPLLEARFDLTGVVISLTAANDYGGTKIADAANTNMLIAGGIIDAVATMAGFTANVGTGVTFGLGSAVASNATLASTMQDYVPVTSATGAAATATLKAHSFDIGGGGPALIFLDAHATNNDLFLNAACPVATGTGTLTFTSGFASLFFFDLSETA
jgi:hypothetical protein